jgi:3-methyladenine DNA glycosylase Mpg
LYDVPNTHARDLNMTEGLRKVHFRKGRNKIFFKMANGPTRLCFSLVLTK